MIKLCEGVIERRLRRGFSISKNQFGFMLGKSTTETIHFIKRFIELYGNRKKNFDMVFIDLEKAYDKVPCEVLSVWKRKSYR